jgi:hypothetical protein
VMRRQGGEIGMRTAASPFPQEQLFPISEPPGGLLLRMPGFVGQHSFLGTFGAFQFLSANFFDPGALHNQRIFLPGFNLVEEQGAGAPAILSLLPGFLALDLNPTGPMQQHDARGSLVDVLAAMSTGADKGFLNVGFTHAEGSHSLRELRFLFQTGSQ